MAGDPIATSYHHVCSSRTFDIRRSAASFEAREHTRSLKAPRHGLGIHFIIGVLAGYHSFPVSALYRLRLR